MNDTSSLQAPLLKNLRPGLELLSMTWELETCVFPSLDTSFYLAVWLVFVFFLLKLCIYL